MKNLYLLSFFTLIVLLSMGCRPQNEKSEDFPVIKIGEAISENKGVFLSQLGNKLTYVPLEMTEESLLADGPTKMFISDDYIIINNFSRAGQDMLVFDRETGKFLNKVAHLGEDPEAVVGFGAEINYNTKELYFPGLNKIQIYGIKGNYIRSIPVHFRGWDINSFVVEGGDPIIYKGKLITNDTELDGTSILKLNKEGEVIDSLHIFNPIYYDPTKVVDANGHVLRGSTMTAPGIVEFIEMNTGEIFYSFQNTRSLWTFEDKVRFHEVMTDTIYNYADNSLTPAYILEKGNYGFRLEENGTKELLSNTTALYYILESKERMILYGGSPFHNNRWVSCFIYNKENNEVTCGKVADNLFSMNTDYGIKDDINGFVPLMISCVNPKGEYGALLYEDQILEWIENNPDYELPEQLRWIKEQPEDANPIAVILSNS